MYVKIDINVNSEIHYMSKQEDIMPKPSKQRITSLDSDTGEILDRTEIDPAKNHDFVQLYRQFISDIADLGLKDSIALQVLLFLVRNMDGANALACPMKLIAEMLHVTRQTVSAKINYLAENGWITKGRIGKQNIYIVNPDVVWTSYDYQKQYCKFQATVMLSADDNLALRKIDTTHIKYVSKDALIDYGKHTDPTVSPTGTEG